MFDLRLFLTTNDLEVGLRRKGEKEEKVYLFVLEIPVVSDCEFDQPDERDGRKAFFSLDELTRELLSGQK